MAETCLLYLKNFLFTGCPRSERGILFMYDIAEMGNRIRELRKREGKTQEETAADMGISVKTYRAIEQGQRGASVDTLLLLSEYFEFSMDF